MMMHPLTEAFGEHRGSDDVEIKITDKGPNEKGRPIGSAD